MVDFCVYLHINKKTKEVFYVGKGKGDRAWNTVSVVYKLVWEEVNPL